MGKEKGKRDTKKAKEAKEADAKLLKVGQHLAEYIPSEGDGRRNHSTSNCKSLLSVLLP
jgi:hypothetical protein